MSTNAASEVWFALKEFSSVPFEDGSSLELPVSDLRDLVTIPWLVTDSDMHPAIFVSPVPERDWSSIEAETLLVENGIVVSHLESGSRFRCLQDVEDVAHLLGALPDGTILELLTTGPDDSARQRYRGTVKNGTLVLTASAPAMSASTLKRALDFARKSDDFLEFENPDQVEQFCRRLESELSFGDTEAEVEGNRVTIRMIGLSVEDATSLLRPLAFQVLFPNGPWVFPEPDLETMEVLENLSTFIQAFTPPDPTDGTLVYAGQMARYFTAVLESQAHLNPQDKKILDEEMKELGFQPVGDFCCNKIYQTVMRGYCNGNGDWGLAAAHADSMFWCEFYTLFADGSSVTTTTNPLAQNKPSKKLFKTAHPSLEPLDLWNQHIQATAQRATDKSNAAQKDLEGLCSLIDECLEREGISF